MATEAAFTNQVDLRFAAECAQEYSRRLAWRHNPLSWFAPLMEGDSWLSWLAFLAALFGLQMSDEQQGLYRKCTGRSTLPTKASREAWLVVGRRGGKSIVSALVALYLATVRDYLKFLAPGEVATVMVIAQDRKQARVVMRYISGFVRSKPRLSAMVQSETKEAILLSNRVVIEVHTCSFRAVRGYTIAAVICDEIAFWHSEDSANPDTEVLAALKPAMGTIPDSILLGISSPYARKGAMWEAYKKHFGKDGDPVLVWQAETLVMHPGLDPSIIEQAYEEDPSSAAAEYGAEFRRDIENFVPLEVVEENTAWNRKELQPVKGTHYKAFIDPSGGSSDSFTMAIAHTENGKAILDLMREKKPPFSPEETCKEFAADLKRYGISEAKSDYYAGEWPREQLSKHGISVTTSDSNKSEIYLELLPALNSRKLELLDDARLRAQLCGLERRTARSGKDSVDHAPGAHDDLINAAAGAIVRCIVPESGWIEFMQRELAAKAEQEAEQRAVA